MDAIEALVEHAARTEVGDLPATTLERARLMLLDTIGVAVAGYRSPSVRPLLEQVREWGGKPEATVLAFGDRLPAPVAGGVNAALARSWDFDDCDEESGYHPAVGAVPAALAAAEAAGDVSGADLLTALATSVDAVLRIRKAVRLRMGSRMPWTSATFAPITAAFAASRALRLDPETFLRAIGVAYTELSGTPQSHLDGGLAHVAHQGLAVQAGLTAVALARRGLTGARNVLEGKFGLFAAYHYGEYDRERLLDGLGSRWYIDDVSIKPFPCCKMAHGAASGALQLLADGVDPWQVRAVEVRVNEPAYILCADQPFQPPKAVVEAQFSIPYVVGAALVRGQVTLREFAPEALSDPDILGLADRVRVVRDPQLDALGLQVAPTEIEFTLAGGEKRGYRVERIPGQPCEPMSFHEVAQKFEECVRFAFPGVDAARIEAAVEMVGRLEQLDDVRPLVRLLAPSVN